MRPARRSSRPRRRSSRTEPPARSPRRLASRARPCGTALCMVDAMQHVRFGRTGLKVSRLCLGTMTFGYQCDDETSFAIMDAAAEAGITFLDTADVYPLGAPPELFGRTEEVVGRWLGSRRDNFIIATKCFFPTGPNPWDCRQLTQEHHPRPRCVAAPAGHRLRRPVPVALVGCRDADRRDVARSRRRRARRQGSLHRVQQPARLSTGA